MILPSVTTEALNVVLAMYARHLLSGHNLFCKTIRATTASKYLYNAATLLLHFDPMTDRDARKRSPYSSSLCPEITLVLKEARRLEVIPNRREPLTLHMQQHLRTLTLNSPPDSLLAALADWFTVGLVAGFRKSEWCQTRTKRKLGSHAISPLGDPVALTLGDVSFTNANGNAIPHHHATKHRGTVKRVTITWRWQKNGERHTKKGFSRNDNNTKLDIVEPWLNIVTRFLTLVPPKLRHLPIAVYRDQHSMVCNITDADVDSALRLLATEVYDITDKKDLGRFTCHSIRVGACCILQAAGASPDFIKKQLRWNSDSWQIYTRDLHILSHKHNEILNTEVARPVQRY